MPSPRSGQLVDLSAKSLGASLGLYWKLFAGFISVLFGLATLGRSLVQVDAQDAEARAEDAGDPRALAAEAAATSRGA